jgi:hypothetical protein
MNRSAASNELKTWALWDLNLNSIPRLHHFRALFSVAAFPIYDPTRVFRAELALACKIRKRPPRPSFQVLK